MIFNNLFNQPQQTVFLCCTDCFPAVLPKVPAAWVSSGSWFCQSVLRTHFSAMCSGSILSTVTLALSSSSFFLSLSAAPRPELKLYLPLFAPAISCQPLLFKQSENKTEQSLHIIIWFMWGSALLTAARPWRPLAFEYIAAPEQSLTTHCLRACLHFKGVWNPVLENI